MEKHYEFRKKLMNIHKPDRINDAVWKKIKGLVIDDTWTIGIPHEAGVILQNAARDLQKYFAVSMKLHLDIVTGTVDRQIRLFTTLTAWKPAYRVAVNDNIILDGTDEKMSAQAVYALEDQMSMNEGPVLQMQDQVYTPMFSTRMVHSGLGDKMFPDEHLCAIAHAGMNAILLYIRNILEDDMICSRVNDIITRAADYGIDVYAFTPFKNRRHPSDPDAWEHYDSMYGELFRRCP